MQNGINIIHPKCFETLPVIAGITTRIGGVSENSYATLNMGFNSGDNPDHIINNREILYDYLNADENTFVYANQVHEDIVLMIKPSHKGAGAKSSQTAIPGIDGMITHLQRIFLTIQTADCMSVFLYCPLKKVISLVHAGWKGTRLNIAGKAANLMRKKYSCIPERMIAYLGPCIGADKYQVGREFKKYFSPEFLIERDRKFFFDLNKANYSNLVNAGLNAENIYTDNYCTYTNENLFYSYRRDGEKTGRMLSFFALE